MTAPTTEPIQATSVAAATAGELRTLWAVANAAAASRMYREAFTPREAFARILAGRDLGLSPSDAMAHMNYLDGKFVPSAEIAGSLLKGYVGPDRERYDYRTTGDDRECVVFVLRRYPGEADWTEIGDAVYTFEDAERMELTDASWWKRSPRKMLFWRALTDAIDMHCPQVVHPVQSPAPLSEDADLSELPVAEDDPLSAIGGRAEDPRGIGKASAQHLRRHHEHLKSHGLEQRFVDALNAVGAPEHEDVVQRYMRLDENQAGEMCMRLGKTPAALKTEPPKQEEENTDVV